MYKQGTILMSLLRSINYPLFVMVYNETDQDDYSFRAIVLYDNTWEHLIGDTYNDWNKGKWEKPTYQETAEYSKYNLGE